jgi:hypothetical protein
MDKCNEEKVGQEETKVKRHVKQRARKEGVET